MSINRVSFGNVVDIKYRHVLADNSASKKVDELIRKDNDDIYQSIKNEKLFPHSARSMLVYKKSEIDGSTYKVVSPKYNRIITGDDCLTYDLLHSINSNYANDFADKKSQTIIVDV